MALPATVRVKISSEAAEGISVTPVVVQELALRDLVEHMLGITGKNEARIGEILLRGTLVSGASRFRWMGFEADTEGIRGLLAQFPGSEPERPFAAERCLRVVLRGGRQPIEIPRAAADRKPLLRKTSFWAVLMEAAAVGDISYQHYSYKDRADCYRLDLPIEAAEKLRAASDLVRYSTLREQIRVAAFVFAELYVER